MILTVLRVVEEVTFQEEEVDKVRYQAYKYLEEKEPFNKLIAEDIPRFIVVEDDVPYVVNWALAGNMVELYPVWYD
jgi:hypothetical protein